jgi:ABC-type histidine transport system ATPase subunit
VTAAQEDAPGEDPARGREVMAARRVDQRVLSAGTMAQFCLLLVLLIAASTAVIPDVFNVNNDPHDNTLGCALAADLNPDSGLNSMTAQLLASKNALTACLEHYVPSASLWAQVLGVGLVADAAGAFFWGIPAWKGRRSQVTALRDADVRGDLTPLVEAAKLDPEPEFVIDEGRVTADAFVFGRRTVCLHGGLVAIREADPSRFRAVVLHELAHIRSGDATITFAIVALWRAFLLVLLAPEAVLTGWDWIAGAHSLFGTAIRTLEVVLGQAGLAERARDRVAGYSYGMRQRLGVAAAILKDPRLLILDEPSNGLDPAGQADMCALIRELGGGPRTIVLSSHDMDEVEQLCDRVGIISGGRLLAEGTPGQLRGAARLLVRAEPAEQAAAVVDCAPECRRSVRRHAAVDHDRARGPGLLRHLMPKAARAIYDMLSDAATNTATLLFGQVNYDCGGQSFGEITPGLAFAVLAVYALACFTLPVILTRRRDIL